MLRVQIVPCLLPKGEAALLNRESGRAYTTTLVWHCRVYRRTGHWLSANAAGRLEDCLGGPTLLHAHSRDAAQQGFHEACKVARAQLKLGLERRYPHRHKYVRRTTWTQTGIRVRAAEREGGEGAVLLLARAVAGADPGGAPASPAEIPRQRLQAGRVDLGLCWRHYHWHITLEEGTTPAPAPARRWRG